MIRDWVAYADSAMDWSWLRGAFAHPTIRPSDTDGRVHPTATCCPSCTRVNVRTRPRAS